MSSAKDVCVSETQPRTKAREHPLTSHRDNKVHEVTLDQRRHVIAPPEVRIPREDDVTCVRAASFEALGIEQVRNRAAGLQKEICMSGFCRWERVRSSAKASVIWSAILG